MLASPLRPFVDSLAATFNERLHCDLSLHESAPLARLHGINVLIGLGGPMSGTLVLSLSEQVARRAASSMFLIEADEVNDDVVDSVAELAHQVAAMASPQMPNFGFQPGLPCVMMGRNCRLRFTSDVACLAATGETPWGPAALQLTLALVPHWVAG
jgi:CheY-specific phosphatase CheX